MRAKDLEQKITNIFLMVMYPILLTIMLGLTYIIWTQALALPSIQNTQQQEEKKWTFIDLSPYKQQEQQVCNGKGCELFHGNNNQHNKVK